MPTSSLIALVTGAGRRSGLGFEICKQLAVIQSTRQRCLSGADGDI
ncbi:hypothetical protein [Piscinibacter terrae]|nr:hypothetical protein [Albitalea terrae]